MFRFGTNKATSRKSSQKTAASEDSGKTDHAIPNVTMKRKNSGLDESEYVADSLNKSLSFIGLGDDDSVSSKATTASKTEEKMPQKITKHPAFAKKAKSNNEKACVKIADLTTEVKDPSIIAYIESISEITFQTPKDQASAKTGKLLNITMSDETAKVKAICYREQMSRVSQIIQVGKSYIFRNPVVVNTKYQVPNGIAFDLKLDQNTTIEPSATEIVPFKNKVIRCSNLIDEEVADGEFVDMYAVVVDAGNLEFKEKANPKPGDKPKQWRSISIIDDSNTATIECKLWGDLATDEKHSLMFQVILLKNVKINLYRKVVELSLYQVGELVTSPKGDRVNELKEFVSKNLAEDDEEDEKDDDDEVDEEDEN